MLNTVRVMGKRRPIIAMEARSKPSIVIRVVIRVIGIIIGAVITTVVPIPVGASVVVVPNARATRQCPEEQQSQPKPPGSIESQQYHFNLLRVRLTLRPRPSSFRLSSANLGADTSIYSGPRGPREFSSCTEVGRYSPLLKLRLPPSVEQVVEWICSAAPI
jgi:hypothetical protein